jgi:hypothetical protein
MRPLIVIPFLLALFAFACSSDSNSNDNKTPRPTSAATLPPQTGESTPTALLSIQTPKPLATGFASDPVSATSVAPSNATLILADAGAPGDFDRMTFQMQDLLPAYDIKYVSGPVQQCASGQDVQIAGQAFLQVRFSPAIAHDDQGAQTVSPTDLQPGLPVIQQATQVCDYEGVVTWVLGLSSQVPYRVFTLGDAILVIDFQHP